MIDISLIINKKMVLMVNNFAVAFGELDISPITIAFMILIAIFVVVAVGISSIQLIRFVLGEKNKS